MDLKTANYDFCMISSSKIKSGTMNINFDDLKIAEYFEPLKENPDRSFVEVANKIERDAKIETHPFFETAKNSREALILWTSQEAIVTNPFSQILFQLIGNVKNVHVRSILMPVVGGEHSKVKAGTASKSHPWLIWKLCGSLNLKAKDIKPTKAIIDFIKVLADSAENPMYGLGVLGIGNELMLLAEYTAIESCFDNACPDADYRDFLHANIGEDEVHSRLIGDAAAALATLGFSVNDFLAGAKDGVKARISYYDALTIEIANTK
jgi:hypothetical protein